MECHGVELCEAIGIWLNTEFHQTPQWVGYLLSFCKKVKWLWYSFITKLFRGKDEFSLQATATTMELSSKDASASKNRGVLLSLWWFSFGYPMWFSSGRVPVAKLATLPECVIVRLPIVHSISLDERILWRLPLVRHHQLRRQQVIYTIFPLSHWLQ